MRRPLAIAGWALGGLLSLTCLGAPPGDRVPQPVAAWPAGPLEVRVASGRPLDPEVARAMVGRSIPFGMSSTSRPGELPPATTLGALRIAAARLVDDGRTLVLATDPHPREATYVLTLPVAGADRTLAYDLNGAEVAWGDGLAGAAPGWSGWWPVVDSGEARRLTAGSVEHERGFALLARPGRLSIRTFVALPKGKATVRLEADGPFEATLANEEPKSSDAPGGRRQAVWELESSGEAVELAATIPTGVGGKAANIRAAYRARSDAEERPLPRAWQVLSWAPPPPPATAQPSLLPLALAGGDWRRGEAIFFGEEAKCSSCHKVRGKGGDVGPDLGDRVGRDPAEVYRDIADPSAVIKPEYMPYTVALKDGQVAVGVVRAEGADAIRVLDTNGKATIVKRSEIEELRPSGTSIMPVGLVGALGEARMRDLLTFLLGPPPTP